MAYTRSWDETAPLGSAQASTIDDILRNLKIDLRERLNVLFTDFTTDPVVANANISDAGTTTVINCLTLTRTTTGTAAAGLGGRALFQLEDAAGNTDAAGAIDILWTDATGASEDADLVVRLMDAGSAHAEKFRINSDGNISFTGTQTVFQSGGITGTLAWAPATANKTITLPNGTTDFTATGGTGQFVKQASAGAALTVATVAASEIASGAALTKTDDTNVTLTLGGSPTTSLLAATSLTLGWTGTLAVARGGTAGSVASITLFNNITGYTAAGATGTTSTNLVFSTSPSLVTPILGVATGTSLSLTATSNQITLQSAGITGTITATPTSSGKVWTLPDATGTVAVSATSPITLSAAGAIGITQTSITSLGTIGTGVWNGTVIAPAYGGTGVANNAAMTVTGSGNYAYTRTLTAATNVTFPTTGTLATLAGTETFTNKRVTKRTGTTTSSATPTINTDNVDFYSITAQAEAITSFTTNLSGTPTEAQTLWIAITGTAARAITWGASFESSTVTLPTTTVSTSRLDVGFVWNTVSSKWRCIATA